MAETLYDVMQVSPGASFEELRKAYRERAKRLHPDRLARTEGYDYEHAVRAMQELNEAWQVLRDPVRRQGYDRELGLSVRVSSNRSRAAGAVSFPFHSLGDLSIRPRRVRRGAISSPARERDAIWAKLGPARGQVRVPPEHDLRLVVGRSASFDLAALASLRPADVQVLDLSRVPSTGDRDLEYVAALEGLTALDLSGTQVTDKGVRLLTALGDLAELSLAGTAVTDACLRYLRALPALRDLDVSGTAVTGRGLQHLRELPGLRRLRLADTVVADEWVAELTGMRLRRLDLSGTKVGLDSVLRLKSSMPSCLVSCRS